MWHSQSIVSLKATKSILEYFCISPFPEKYWSQWTCYFSFIFVYEIVFFSAFYHSIIQTGDFSTHAHNYDTFYCLHQMRRFVVGTFFCFCIIISLCNRSAQLQLLSRMAALDIKIKSHLRIEPSFRRLNIEFILFCVLVTVYNYGAFVFHVYSKFDLNHVTQQIYYFCSTLSEIYFYSYGFYTVYWARAYTYRSGYIIDALKAAMSQRSISKPSLSIILELIKLLFDVRESIQDAFGSILFMIVSVITFESAESSFGVVHIYERHPDRIYLWLDYIVWFLFLWSQLTFIFASFNKIGDVVSGCA